MRMVLKFDCPGPNGQPWPAEFPQVLLALLEDGHCVTLVHGSSAFAGPSAASLENNGDEVLRFTEPENEEVIASIGTTNKFLVSRLNAAGIPAIGLCGADGRILRTRKKFAHGSASSSLAIASVDPFWLDVISQRKGIPLMANLGPGTDGGLHCLDAGELAAACAVAWQADALIFLTAYEGIRNTDGEIIRWLESGRLQTVMQDSKLSPEALSHLRACQDAIVRGVRRVRILPFARVASLAQFYFTRIVEGTEVILSTA
jgi:acetylglutamate kinase